MNNHQIANKPEEILDHVDNTDRIIGQVVRKQANSDPQFTHREVGILIVNKKGEVLLQKRSQYKTIHPSMWSITAGHILTGEDPEATAHTELKEELGFDTDLIFLEKKFHQYPHETHFMYYYLGVHTDQKIVLEKAEVEKVAFYSAHDLENLIGSDEEMNEKHLPVIKKFFAGLFNNQLAKLST